MAALPQPTTKLDIVRRFASWKQFFEARPYGCPLFKSVAHDTAQHKAYRKKRGHIISTEAAYMRNHDDAVAEAAQAARLAADEAANAPPPAIDARDKQLQKLWTMLRVAEGARDEQARRVEYKQQELKLLWTT